MLSYRHAFHAGNFADVHKHTALVLGIEALRRKPGAFCVLDAYAGSGAYSLSGPAALTGEWREGVGKLMAAADPPEALMPYLDRVRAANPPAALNDYPGSPALAATLLREHDRLVCLELHPSDYQLLKAHFAGDKRVQVHRRNAHEGLPALLPPAEKRGLVLLDPPYERNEEYAEVPASLRRAYARWPHGSYLLWYPLLAGNPHERLLVELTGGDIRRVLVQELRLYRDAPGLRGSGILWVNPPWQVDAALQQAGPWLAEHLGASGAGSRLEWRVPE
jgi:23S rRNA (adenine2030-N6)-methyltransferase